MPDDGSSRRVGVSKTDLQVIGQPPSLPPPLPAIAGPKVPTAAGPPARSVLVSTVIFECAGRPRWKPCRASS